MATTSTTSSIPPAIAGGSFSADEKRVLQLCEQFKAGVTHAVLINDMPHLTQQMVVDVLNKLLNKGKLDLLSKPDKTLLYKLKDPISHHKLRGINKEEQAVFEIIERSGKFGIWARKIRKECNLHDNIVDKVLKRLEGKKLIQSITSVQAPKKKIYLVCGVEPDRSLTGGVFYSGNTFDSSFVEILTDTCYKYLEQKLQSSQKNNVSDGPLAVVNGAKVTAKEMKDCIDRLKFSKVSLNVEDVERILDVLVLDGRVASYNVNYVEGGEGVKLWRALPDWAPTPHILRAPCGVCPMIDKCSDIGDITPLKCPYLDDWLA